MERGLYAGVPHIYRVEGVELHTDASTHPYVADDAIPCMLYLVVMQSILYSREGEVGLQGEGGR
jgi:hypothetical protein